MLTYRVGASASAMAGVAMAKYLTTETLRPEHEAMARYYAGDVPPLPTSLVEELAAGMNRGDVGYSEALAELVLAEIALVPQGVDFDIDQMEERISLELEAAATRDDFAQAIADQGGTVAELRPDISPALANRLGIVDPGRPLTETGIAHLLNGKRIDGGEIEGKHTRSPTLSVAAVFGIDANKPLTGEAMRNVLEGRRVDGEVPKAANGGVLDGKVVDGAARRFRSAMGVPNNRQPTPVEVGHLLAGRSATGGFVDPKDFRRNMNATRPPVGFIDLTFSADKSLSVAWALAPTAAEQAVLLDIHKHAVADAMSYVEERIGFARKGDAGSGGVDAGKIGWISFQHYTARPAVDIVRVDSDGQAYTDPREVPLQTADPQLHTHATVFNAVLTDAGRLGSIDLDRLDGFVKEGGAIYQAAVATHARRFGIEVLLDERTGSARLADVPESVRAMFSKRSREALEAARDLAKSKGLDWDSLNGEQQVSFIKSGADETRNAKDRRSMAGEGQSDFAVWRSQAEAAGYQHRSVLRPDEIKPELTPEQRRALASEASQPLIEREFGQRARLSGDDLRVIAARGLIATGIGDRPGEDIAAVLKSYQANGVSHSGEKTAIVFGKDAPLRGKERWAVTTALHERQERELIGMARAAAADTSGRLSEGQIGRAVEAFLARNPRIDPNGEHWRKQHDMMVALGSGGRLGVGIGAAGSGKSTVIEPLVDAWKDAGRRVFGATVAWRQSADLGAAGIEARDRAALDPFLRRAAAGKYELDRNSVVVVDEVGLVGTRQELELLRLQAKHGFTLVQLGDEKQCQSVEAGPVIDLLRTAIGEAAVPQILTSIRQKTEREREITGLLREGDAGRALEMKRDDGSAILAPGGWDATVQHVARIWHDRSEANKGDPDYRLTVSTETNAGAREIGLAIRTVRQEAGQLGSDEITISATDAGGARYSMGLAVGEKVRLFDRVHDANTPGRATVLANNGDVVELRQVTEAGMLVRNASGAEGLIAWNKLRQNTGDPVRLAYGYAATVNVSQGVTSTEHIHALRSSHGLTAYTALSRHQKSGILVIDEAAVRQRVHAAHLKSGGAQPISLQTVWNKVGEEISQQPVKASALTMLSQVTGIRRGSVRSFQHNVVSAQKQRAPEVRVSARDQVRMAPALQHIKDRANRVAIQVQQAFERARGPSRDQHAGPGLGH